MTTLFTQEQNEYLDSIAPEIVKLKERVTVLESLDAHLTDLENRVTNFQIPDPLKQEIHTTTLDDCCTLFEERISNLETKNHSRIQDHLQRLEQRFETHCTSQTHLSSSSGVLTVAPTPKSTFKLKEPPKFSGKREECHSFFSHLALHFAKSPKDFEDDSAKVLFAVSYLEGQPFRHMEPYLTKIKNNPDLEDYPTILTDFEVFEKAMTNSYGIANAPVAAAAKIKVLKQTSTVAAYATEFRRLAMDLKWNDDALTSQFESGLKDSILDSLANEAIITDLEKLIERATELDDCQFA